MFSLYMLMLRLTQKFDNFVFNHHVQKRMREGGGERKFEKTITPATLP